MPKWEAWNCKKKNLQYICCKLTDFGGHENWSKMEVQIASTSHQNWSIGQQRFIFWYLYGFGQDWFLVFFHLAKRRAENTTKSGFARLPGPRIEILEAINNPGGPLSYTGRFYLDSTFSYLTTPDTGRCRRILVPTRFRRSPKIIHFCKNQDKLPTND